MWLLKIFVKLLTTTNCFQIFFTNGWVVYGFKNSNNIFYSVYNWYGIFIFSLVFLISNWNLGYFFRRIPSCSTSLPILSLWISITNALVIWLYPFRYKLALRLSSAAAEWEKLKIFFVCVLRLELSQKLFQPKMHW